SRAAADRDARLVAAHVRTEDDEDGGNGDDPEGGGGTARMEHADPTDAVAREYALAGVEVEVTHRWGRPDIEFEGLARQMDAALLILPWHDEPDPDAGTADERAALRSTARYARRLFLDPPCEAWLVLGGLAGRDVKSLLVVPSEREPSPRALEAARALLGEGARLDVLDVHERAGGEPSDGLRERLDDILGPGSYEVTTVASKSRERAMIEQVEKHPYDVLVMDVPVEGVVPGLLSPHLPEDLAERLDGQPLVVVNGPQRRAVVRVRRLLDRIYLWLGTLDARQRVDVYTDLRRQSRADREFLALTVLATAIAALGLLLDSAAVIIGAMLVAPFMAPTVALGLAVVYGDVRFIRLALVAMLKGTLVGFGVGLMVGVLLPPTGLSDELVARTDPSGLDLMVALLSGAAGAYAFGRRELSAALPGVAIAASLVPPLAASAITLGAGEWAQGLRALVLYLMNLVAIAGASAVIFLWFGFRPEVQRFGRVRSFLSGLVMIGALLSLVLAAVVVLGNQDRVAAQRERAVETVIEAWLPAATDLQDFAVTEVDGAIEVALTVASRQGLQERAAGDLALALAAELGRPVRVALEVHPVFGAAASPTPEP
ncbi:MAG: DUF389 domain-containing protein, partial [Dehalococcoidia bacterium]